MINSTKRALWVGRFQPPTSGHIVAVLSILSQWKNLTIGIVENSTPPVDINQKWVDYLKQHHGTVESLTKNPFTPKERIKMWQHVLKEYNLKHRVNLISMPRVAYQSSFNQSFSPKKYDMVDIELSDTDPESDYLRQKVFKKNLKRKIFYIKVPIKTHVTEIKNLINKGQGWWKEFLSKKEYVYFMKINGPERMVMKM